MKVVADGKSFRFSAERAILSADRILTAMGGGPIPICHNLHCLLDKIREVLRVYATKEVSRTVLWRQFFTPQPGLGPCTNVR